jgi:hypothetical protein
VAPAGTTGTDSRGDNNRTSFYRMIVIDFCGTQLGFDRAKLLTAKDFRQPTKCEAAAMINKYALPLKKYALEAACPISSFGVN